MSDLERALDWIEKEFQSSSDDILQITVALFYLSVLFRGAGRLATAQKLEEHAHRIADLDLRGPAIPTKVWIARARVAVAVTALSRSGMTRNEAIRWIRRHWDITALGRGSPLSWRDDLEKTYKLLSGSGHPRDVLTSRKVKVKALAAVVEYQRCLGQLEREVQAGEEVEYARTLMVGQPPKASGNTPTFFPS